MKEAGTYIDYMEKHFACACCGEGHSVFIDPDDGDVQELEATCSQCGCDHHIAAKFNYPTGSYDIDVTHEAVS